ncbi:DUF6445 family protein [Microbulbifer guangxiensis]|uniref:DUF6445 family protein n=1 Tax=Microbulbifer guangxiensis TaxID=2904249 RepID=UPI001F276F0C|nr:DUF6445 family protein [Microbulbifer guangxiensis]
MQVSIERLGNEQTPIVIIDDAHPQPEQLVRAARNSQWLRENPYYPGMRAQVPADYLSPLLEKVADALEQAYDLDTRNGLASAAITNAFCCYSMVTKPPTELQPIQSLPHFDATHGRQLAMLHYLCDKPFRGTAFFRHRESGFENILDDRVTAYQAQAGKHLEQVQPGYASECGDWYEKVGEVEARFNRVTFYPASLLHSGIVGRTERLSDNAVQGRLTITGFIDLTNKLNW